jgi:lysozyme
MTETTATTETGFVLLPDDPGLLQLEVENEDFKASAYRDSEGFLTIGIGRMIDVRKGGGITREEANYLCRNDNLRKMQELDKAIPWWRSLDPARQRVLVDMAFNMGVGQWGKSGLLDFTNTLTAVKEGRWQDAYKGILDSNKPGGYAYQTGRRAKRNANTLLTGVQLSYAALGLK